MNKNKEKNNFLFPMVIMSILFFMVGFITTTVSYTHLTLPTNSRV